MPAEVVDVADDVALHAKVNAQRRTIAGKVLVHRVAGALTTMMADRLADPKMFAHIRQELGIDP